MTPNEKIQMDFDRIVLAVSLLLKIFLGVVLSLGVFANKLIASQNENRPSRNYLIYPAKNINHISVAFFLTVTAIRCLIRTLVCSNDIFNSMFTSVTDWVLNITQQTLPIDSKFSIIITNSKLCRLFVLTINLLIQSRNT